MYTTVKRKCNFNGMGCCLSCKFNDSTPDAMTLYVSLFIPCTLLIFIPSIPFGTSVMWLNIHGCNNILSSPFTVLPPSHTHIFEFIHILGHSLWIWAYNKTHLWGPWVCVCPKCSIHATETKIMFCWNNILFLQCIIQSTF